MTYGPLTNKSTNVIDRLVKRAQLLRWRRLDLIPTFYHGSATRSVEQLTPFGRSTDCRLSSSPSASDLNPFDQPWKWPTYLLVRRTVARQSDRFPGQRWPRVLQISNQGARLFGFGGAGLEDGEDGGEGDGGGSPVKL